MDFKAAVFYTSIVLVLGKNTFCTTSIYADTHDVSIKLHESQTVHIVTRQNFTSHDETLNIIVQHSDIASINITSIPLIHFKPNESIFLKVTATGAGKTDVYSNTSSNLTDVKDVYFKVTVYKVAALSTISTVIGWMYFVAWSVSFYPQAYINWKRKSVIGLNFDFLALNLVGFILYSVFNLGLFYIPEIKDEYAVRYPRGLNPVQVNDIFFAVHAVVLTCVTIVQCFIYDRADQRVSITARVILGIFALFLVISAFLSGFNVIHWLDFLYYCSYVKLTITLIKYIPQAFMNYRRKSTSGWSIGNILLDFTGGTLSMLQMILNAYNYDDWVSIFGDPTKFGLGLFSVAFDIFFMLQHYVFYRLSSYEDK